jgi:protein gp37
MNNDIVVIELRKAILEPGLQPRNELNSDAIRQYTADMKAGDIFPPIDIVKVNGKHYVTGGWHRVLAARGAGKQTIDSYITEGTLEDAKWYACASNVEHDKSGSRRTNADKQKAVKMALRLERFQNGQMNYSEIARHVGVSPRMVTGWGKRLGIINNNNTIESFNIVKPVTIDPTPQRESGFHEQWREERAERLKTEFFEDLEVEEIVEEIETESRAKFNKVNENIEWAAWSWNPVTGCLHDCDYCYARDIANRFYPEGFQPSYHPDRLDAPANTNVPTAPRFYNDTGYKNVFTCSMADLFGKWVPEEWIQSVIDTAAANQQWNFLFLTKFPIRMAEFSYPSNVWLGTTVDRQHAVSRAEIAFKKIKASGFDGICWLSCEPMLEQLTFESLEMFDWVVMGGSSKSTQTPEYKPPFEDVLHLYEQARASDCQVYMKTNLLGERVREYPK